ncbi:DHA2 family efflux MFS transporter permease subunit [Paracraurococcus lichenis]|uniref:DHA2 family efflux MFS transporter permease subunit n=1 Tax=Paracraurococcus lichenis TaxID=3064888 RepID=A0ABT9DZP6_9PROT|nr:DHA2 family efflux MFS transporter permease subunit [Paracraurococcus sp. LOR1-02]MDO9709375.1 DHA2 family efflux MFS transporter permease subunit [Paracraurococcus sp. LOR1-02]
MTDLPRSAAGGRSPWLIASVVSIATFMEVLDTTIANVALRHMAGGVGASQDESTWILTTYLVTNAIILPVSGYLATLIGRKRFYMGCVAVFTLASLGCALSPSLPVLLACRAIQGLGGGGLAPVEQSILADTFPPERRAGAFALYGLTVVTAPAMGPALGGWITDNYSWHWIFLINLPFGALSLFLVSVFVKEPEAVREDRRRAREENAGIDWVGFGLAAVALGSLQVVLDRAVIDDGFWSPLVTWLTVACVVGFMLLIPWERRQARPAVDVRLFAHRSFLAAALIMFLVAFTLFSTTQLLPQLTQDLMGYDATTAGLTLAVGGLGTVVAMPIAGRVTGLVQPRWVILVALLWSGGALLYATNIDLQMGFWHVSTLRVLQVMALPFLFVPITTAAYVGLPPDKTNDASALINLMRNLGASVGISVMNAVVTHGAQFHQNRLIETATEANPLWVEQLRQTEQALRGAGVGAWEASQATLQQLSGQVAGQAQVLSYMDAFWLLGVAVLTLWPLVFLMRDIPKGAATGGH